MRPATDRRRPAAALLVSGAVAAACSASSGNTAAPSSPLPQGDERVELDPADFTADITNRWWPMPVGARWVFAETDADGATRLVEVTVLDETRTVAGIEARVVHDRVTEGGALVEDTRDWYAQDAAGNVWYLGEQTAEYEDGRVVGTDGSWEAGVDGAQAGIAVPASPAPGTAYRQEHLAGEAEDEAVVLSTDERVQVPTGAYTGALLTRDTTPLEPDVSELKFYVRDLGPVLALTVSGGSGREELVEAPGG